MAKKKVKKEDIALDDPWLRGADVKHEELAAELSFLKTGHDPVAARSIIEYFHERMSNGLSYDKNILHDLMAHVFAGIVAGKSADQAFGLKLVRGGYERPDTIERDVPAAASVMLLMRKKKTWEQAIGETADRFFPDENSERTVERAYAKYREELETCTDEQLRETIGPD
ncbi:hypothetical protein [Azotobacter salinestris]|uniref:hypothetical protein n=1 Tax=Azotobacter salinestris TaxID=69964 RepID=UPI0012668E5B|nr:hypothetical protein [Azotobacter salinestris]